MAPILAVAFYQNMWVWAGVWTIVWLLVLATALARKDLDPVTRLTWVLVIILVPFFGVLLYWLVAPASEVEQEAKKDYTTQATVCVQCGTRIPAASAKCPKCGWSYA